MADLNSTGSGSNESRDQALFQRGAARRGGGRVHQPSDDDTVEHQVGHLWIKLFLLTISGNRRGKRKMQDGKVESRELYFCVVSVLLGVPDSSGFEPLNVLSLPVANPCARHVKLGASPHKEGVSGFTVSRCG